MRTSREIKTERLLLRPHVMEDAEALHRLFGTDPEMTAYTGWNPYATVEQAREMLAEVIRGQEEKEHAYGWAVTCGSEIVGIVSAYDYDPMTQSAELGLSIAREHWGKGYGTEALTAMLDCLAGDGLRSVTAWCADGNIGSKTVMEKAGMQFVRAEKDALTVDGNRFDKLYYERIFN